jgi:hypothetical protein
MYKWTGVIFILVIISVLPPLIGVKIVINNIIMIMIYATCAVLFFRCKNRILSIDLREVKHPIYLNALSKSIRQVNWSLIWLFVCMTIFFVIDLYLDLFHLSIPLFDFRVFTAINLLLAIEYYDCNCRGIRRLKDEINHI